MGAVDPMQRSQALQIAAGFTAALLLNIFFLACLLLEKVSPQWSVPEANELPVQLMLGPLSPAAPRSDKSKARFVAPAASAPRPPALARAAIDGEAPTLSRPAQAPTINSPTPAATPPPPAAPSVDGELRARTSSALRRLGACSDLTVQNRPDARCGQAWGDTGAEIDPLTPSVRADLDTQKSDPAARLQRSTAVRGALNDHSQEGSSLHYGCTLKHEQVQCSTY